MEPTNKNLFSLSKAQMVFERLPHMTFFLQSITLPGLNTGFVEFNTAFSNVPIPGDSIQYDDLTCNFLLDEELETIKEIKQWMINNNKRDNHEQYNHAAAVDTATIFLNTNNNTKNIKIEFEGIFPVDLGSFELAYNEMDDSEPIIVTTMFKFQRWDFV